MTAAAIKERPEPACFPQYIRHTARARKGARAFIRKRCIAMCADIGPKANVFIQPASPIMPRTARPTKDAGITGVHR